MMFWNEETKREWTVARSMDMPNEPIDDEILTLFTAGFVEEIGDDIDKNESYSFESMENDSVFRIYWNAADEQWQWEV